MTGFPRLFEPFIAKRLTLANRIVMLPHGTGMARDGAVTDDDIAYHKARAQGGLGLIITGVTIVHPSSVRQSRTAIEAYDERVLPGMKRRCDAIHAFGTKVIG